jgi:hypothetical protein
MLKLFPVVVAMLLTVGCSRSVCEEMADAERTTFEKSKACFDTPPEVTDVQQCEERLKKCNDKDEELFGNFADCVRKLPVCTEAEAASWEAAHLECIEAVFGNLSRECVQQ